MESPIEKLPAVIKLANAEDETTGDAYEVFEFTKLLVGVSSRKGLQYPNPQELGMPPKMKFVLLPSLLRQYEILRSGTCCTRVISAGVEVEKPLCCKRKSSGPRQVS